jgi:two-component system sensor histidine kinase/response regulator
VDDGLEDIAVIGDMNRIKQVLFNFFSNAYKFTPHGGTVSMELTDIGRTMVGNDFTRIRMRTAVCDTGIGIAVEDASRIFVPWSQVRREPPLKLIPTFHFIFSQFP